MLTSGTTVYISYISVQMNGIIDINPVKLDVNDIRMTVVVRVLVKSLVYEERLQLENIFSMLMDRGMTQTYS